nr:META domain-containing protein [Nocardioides baekrokdamisoli]
MTGIGVGLGLHGRFLIPCVGTGADQSPAPDPRPAPPGSWITFDTRGHVSGNDGVNDWTGTYTEQGNVLRVHLLGATAVGSLSTAPWHQAFSELEAGKPVTFMWSDDSPSTPPALALQVGEFVINTRGRC